MLRNLALPERRTSATSGRLKTVLHYTGYDDDRGGIVTVVRNLATAGRFACVLGVNAGAVQQRTPPLPVLELPRLQGETIGLGNGWRARAVARAVQTWLRADPGRIFHGHSRAGLLVALWLHRLGERRVVASVHCYGRQRWFYRWAQRHLKGKLFWLSPAMRAYYGVAGDAWDHCIPGGVVVPVARPASPSPGRLRVGGVGSLVAWKRWDVVIAAVARAVEAGADVTFEHIGGGDESLRGALQRQAEQSGVAGRVRFCGQEASSQRLLGVIDALVLASENEPFSMAMLEALAAGIPVAAADSGGALDVIKEGVNGRLFRTGDAGTLTEILREWTTRPPVWSAQDIRGTTCEVGDIAARWAEVYAKL